MNIKRNIIFALESRKKNGVPIVENVPIRMRVAGMVNALVLSQQASQNFEQGMSEQQSREEQIKR